MGETVFDFKRLFGLNAMKAAGRLRKGLQDGICVDEFYDFVEYLRL